MRRLVFASKTIKHNGFKTRRLLLKLKTMTVAVIDNALGRVVVDVVLDGRFQQQARNMIFGPAGALSVPASLFPLAIRSLQGFEAVAPSAMIDPATLEEALLMSEGLLNLRTRHGIRATAGCLIQFAAYLPPSGLLQLRGRAMHPPCRGKTSGPHQSAIVTAMSTGLAKTKTVQQDQTLLMDLPGRELVADVLDSLNKVVVLTAQLFGSSAQQCSLLRYRSSCGRRALGVLLLRFSILMPAAMF
jgi:hypothetical protein